MTKRKMMPRQRAAMAAMFAGFGYDDLCGNRHDRGVHCEVNGDAIRRDKAEAKRRRRAEKKSAPLKEKRP